MNSLIIQDIESNAPLLLTLSVSSCTQKHWSEDPFAANKKENGDIVARGTQVHSPCHSTQETNIVGMETQI